MAIDLVRPLNQLEKKVEPPSELIKLVVINWGPDNEVTSSTMRITPEEYVKWFGKDPGTTQKVSVDKTLATPDGD